MLRANKADVAREIRERFERMSSAVFLDYNGMTVQQVSRLRETFRQQGIEYRVVKNTLVRKAVDDWPWAEHLGNALRGMTAVAWSFDEPSAAARVVKEFRKEKANEKLRIKAGLLDGQVLDPDAVENQLATLPNKDEARSMLLATMMAPAQQLVGVLAAPSRDFVGVMAAKQRQLEGGGSAG
ncbi:50S ribosomal protein L10 [Myxococcota bacterium]